ncbi:MAG: hypothetical protein AB1641_05630 [Thermodesulfobacteriota bacterium]
MMALKPCYKVRAYDPAAPLPAASETLAASRFEARKTRIKRPRHTVNSRRCIYLMPDDRAFTP